VSARLLRTALKLVPREWRAAVAHDLDEEPASDVRRAVLAIAIGLKLRSARAVDALGHPRALASGNLLRDFTRDLTFAIRGAVRRPAYSLTVIGTLAIGIGANAAIFSVFNWVLFRPMPGAARPSELVTILFQTSRRQGQFYVSYRDVADLRDNTPALASLAASAPMTLDLGVREGLESERADVELVTANYFAMFGATPSPGRDFLPGEEQTIASTPPVIISRALWKRRFNASPSALGQQLTINGHAFTVVGVAPPSFQGRSLVTATDLWIPIGAHMQVLPSQGRALLTDRRQTLFGDAFGRLGRGATVALVQQQTRAVADRVPGFARRTPASRDPVAPVVYERVGQSIYVRERLSTIFRLVIGGVGLLLLLACANAANLLLARSLARRREIGVCQAIGASRLRVVRQQMTEGLVLAAAAGALGLALAVALTALFDGMRLVSFLPAVRGVGVDIRVIVFTAGVALVTGAIFALGPALASSRVDLNAALKDGLTSTTRRPFLRNALAVTQVAISILLLICAGLFVRTLANMRALDLGIKAGPVVSFSANPPRHGYDAERASRYFRDVVERLRATPGIQSAAFSWTTPFQPMRSDNGFFVPGEGAARSVVTPAVSPGYFETLGIPILEGRDFTAADSPGAGESNVAVVSRSLAQLIKPDGHAVGSRVLLEYPKGRQVEIIGIVGDVRGQRLTNEPEPFMYQPAVKPTWGLVHVRTAAPLAETIATLRRVSREVDANVTPYDIEPFTASVERALAEPRLIARLSTVFAIVAVLLAGIGIYGIMTCSVGERMREFGIRLAMGAPGRQLLVLVIRYALTVTAAGVAIGVAAASAVSRGLEARLYGLSRNDPFTIAAAGAVLVAIALFASAVPALRASRIDPVRSLRDL
jgi:predicted permease